MDCLSAEINCMVRLLDGQTFQCQAKYTVVEDFVRFTYYDVDCPGEFDDVQWRLDDDGLHVQLLAIQNGSFAELKAMYEAKPWQKVADQ